MATPELQRKLAHLYDSPASSDVFGRRPATPKEIEEAMTRPQASFQNEIVNHRRQNRKRPQAI